MDRSQLKISIVGPCSSGKSTLRRALRTAGYDKIRNPAQEHSGVADMWQRLTKPDILVYLDITYEAAVQRRPKNDLGAARVERQKDRLAHAREHADVYVDTTELEPEQVAQQVLAHLNGLTD